MTLAKIGPRAQAALRAHLRPRGKAGGDLTGSYPNPRLAAPPPQTPVSVFGGYRTPCCGGGWRNFGAPYAGAAYYRDDEGIVHLSGVVQSFTNDLFGPQPPDQNQCESDVHPQIAIFVLPTGDRPAAQEVFAVDSNNAHGRVDVTPDGKVICESGAGDRYVSLSGISFRAALAQSSLSPVHADSSGNKQQTK